MLEEDVQATMQTLASLTGPPCRAAAAAATGSPYTSCAVRNGANSSRQLEQAHQTTLTEKRATLNDQHSAEGNQASIIKAECSIQQANGCNRKPLSQNGKLTSWRFIRRPNAAAALEARSSFQRRFCEFHKHTGLESQPQAADASGTRWETE
jgi:hypothetical protein